MFQSKVSYTSVTPDFETASLAPVSVIDTSARHVVDGDALNKAALRATSFTFLFVNEPIVP